MTGQRSDLADIIYDIHPKESVIDWVISNWHKLPDTPLERKIYADFERLVKIDERVAEVRADLKKSFEKEIEKLAEWGTGNPRGS